MLTCFILIALNRMRHRLRKKKGMNNLYFIILNAIKLPIKILLLVFFISYVVSLIARGAHFDFINTISLIRKVVLVFVLAWASVNVLHQYELYLKKKK